MRANDDIDLAAGQSDYRFFLVPLRGKAAEFTDVEWELGQALGERLEMLFRQHGRRDEHGDLVTAVDRFERRAHRHLGFAKTDVAAYQPVHRTRDRHIAFDGIDGGELIRRLDVGEGCVELTLPNTVAREC